MLASCHRGERISNPRKPPLEAGPTDRGQRAHGWGPRHKSRDGSHGHGYQTLAAVAEALGLAIETRNKFAQVTRSSLVE